MAVYDYSFHEERGEFRAYVEDEQGNTIWSVNYPDYYENEDGELIESSTIFEDGFMEDANDIEGLENYLKSINVLEMGDELIHSYSRERSKDFDYRTFLKYVYSNTREVLRSHGILINENFSVSDGGVYFFHPEIMFQHEGNVSDKLDLNYYDYDMNYIGNISYDLQNQMMAIEFPDWRIDDSAEFEYESYRDGGSVEQGNLDMVKNQVVQVEHHAKELMQTLKSNPQVDAWVVAKMDRATSNLSDITHYLEGEQNSFADGGVTDSNTYEKVKVTIRDVDMGGDVVYKGEHFFRKDQLAKKTNEEIGKHILNKYFLDYGNTYKYSITRTGETKTKMKSGGTVEELEDKAKEKLSTTFQLPLEIAVYVPSTINVDTKISKEEFDKRVDEAETWLGRLWGGFSANDVEGGFVSGKGATQRKLIQEDVVKITCFCRSEGFDRRFDLLLKKLVYWAKEWKQESIGLEVEGDLFYIDVNTTFDNKEKK
jgi:hypothetical protein